MFKKFNPNQQVDLFTGTWKQQAKTFCKKPLTP